MLCEVCSNRAREAGSFLDEHHPHCPRRQGVTVGPVLIVEHEGWSAIYVGGRLAHWNDTPSLARFARLLGVECEFEVLDPEAVNPEDMPETVEEYRRRTADRHQAKLREERDRLCGRIAEINRELSEGKG